MSGRFFLSGTIPLFEGAAQPLSTLTFSLTGTSTAQDTFSDAGLTSANANPVVSDANGYFGEIFIKRERYKVIWKNAAGTTLKAWDPVDKDQVFTRGAGLPSDPHPGQKHANTSDGHTYEYKLATSAWLDLGASDAVGNTATVTEQLTGTSASAYCTPDSVAGLWQRGADIASASTISLSAAGGGVFNITGTTGITGISSAQGGRRVLFRFAASLLLTHNATSFILFGSNITTAAGDIAEFVNDAAQDASGSNWRCVNYQFSAGAPAPSPSASSKTANYTVLDSDRGGSIRFAGLSSDATLTLPAASGRAGFMLYVSNEDTGFFGVTIDPNSAELIDGFSTRKTFVGSRLALVCDGTGWRTVSGRYRFISTTFTPTAAATTGALAHGLGVIPNNVQVQITAVNAVLGYSIGEIVHLSVTGDSNVSGGMSILKDATNITVRVASAGLVIPHKTTGVQTGLTGTDWSARFIAED